MYSRYSTPNPLFFSKHELCIAKKGLIYNTAWEKEVFFKEEGRPTFDHYIEYNYTIFSWERGERKRWKKINGHNNKSPLQAIFFSPMCCQRVTLWIRAEVFIEKKRFSCLLLISYWWVFHAPQRFERMGGLKMQDTFFFSLSGRWPIEWSWPAASPARPSRLDWLTKNRERDGRVEAALTHFCVSSDLWVGSIDLYNMSSSSHYILNSHQFNLKF